MVNPASSAWLPACGAAESGASTAAAAASLWLKGSFLPRVGPAVTQAGSLGPPGQAAHVLLVGAERIFQFHIRAGVMRKRQQFYF